MNAARPGQPAPARSIEQTSWDNWDGRQLREAQQAEMRLTFGEGSFEPGSPPQSSDITVFFVVREPDSEAVGCAGLRQLDDTSGEIKRMYVVPEYRGRGISREILAVLEDFARTAGWTRLLLETGNLLASAIRLYETSGYQAIPAFGPYIGSSTSLCFAKDL